MAQSSQDDLLDFLNDPETIRRAVEGSMGKRLKVMAQSNGGLTTDDVIFNIEDYVGGNIEGVEHIDRMGFTVFLRSQLEAYRKQHELEARIDETEYWRASGFLPLFDADKRIAKLSQILKELEAEL